MSERVRRVEGGVTKQYSYQGYNLASIQTDPTNTEDDTDSFYTIGGGIISNVTERHTLNYTAGTTDSRYYQYDHRGNVVAVSDENGDLQAAYNYDAFGNIVNSLGTGGSTAPTDDILFTGKDLDPDTGLCYFNARWYDSGIGRFVSVASFSVDVEHPYLFCKNDSVNAIESDGNLSIWGILFIYDSVRDHMCAMAWVKNLRGTFEIKIKKEPILNDKEKHCILSCNIARDCGRTAASNTGLIKELWDIITPGNASLKDLKADYLGIEIGQIAECEKECWDYCKQAISEWSEEDIKK